MSRHHTEPLRSRLARGAGTVALGAGLSAAGVWARYVLGCQRVVHWQMSTLPVAPVELGAVERLRVLPVVDWYAARPDLGTEPGVSYFVEADDTAILFDLGLGRRVNGKCILADNLARLGIHPSDVDAIVLSHPHGDHIGGFSNQFGRRLRAEGVLEGGVPAYATVPLRTPDGWSTVVDRPRALAPGVGTTGPLAVQLFVLGTTFEQALVIRVAGRGLVLVVGCAHPGVSALVQRALEAFGGPLYGVIGGLHLPVTADRAGIPGVNVQRVLGSAAPPWVALTAVAVADTIACLRTQDVRLVAPSAHDACDWSLAQLAQAFGDAYRPLRVGDEIRVDGLQPRRATPRARRRLDHDNRPRRAKSRSVEPQRSPL